VLSVGLLVAITLAQVGGDSLANYAAVARTRARTADRIVAAGLIVIFCAGALYPDAFAAVLAPGLEPGGQEIVALRLFFLAGAALVVLWALAGQGQRRLDFWALGAINVVPNACLLLGIALGLWDPVTAIALCMLVGIATCSLIARMRVRRTAAAPVQATARGQAAVEAGLHQLLLLAVATQLNLILVRVVGADLPEGSLGALYIAIGIVVAPVMAVAGAAASVMLPRWAAEPASADLRVFSRTAISAVLVTSALGVAVVATVVLALRQDVVDLGIDPLVERALESTLPILAAGLPLYALAWMVRAYAIASHRVRALAAAGILGALAIPLAALVDHSPEAVAAGYALSAVPWVAAGLWLRGGKAPAAH
jgi:hypothetical protein